MVGEKAPAAISSHCPDPSMHQKQNKLSEQASSAALYVTNPNTKSERTPDPREDVLGDDGRLSSKSTSINISSISQAGRTDTDMTITYRRRDFAKVRQTTGPAQFPQRRHLDQLSRRSRRFGQRL